ncbi:MAG: hypothetical protein MHM6MM_007140 [Cercozoa sp. M6MM]
MQRDWVSHALSVPALLLLAGLANLLIPHTVRYVPLLNEKDVSLQELRSANDALNFPLRTDLVHEGLCAFLALLPTLVIAFGRLKSRVRRRTTIIAILQAMSLTLVATEVLKKVAGRPRPNFLEVCRPVNGLCTNPNAREVADGLKSFPSGHSAAIFAGGVFATLLLASAMRFFANDFEVCLHTKLASTAEVSTHESDFLSFLPRYVQLPLILSPLLGASLVAVSRTVDYHHNFDDIVAGAAIGSVISSVVYFAHFPALTSVLCDWTRSEQCLHATRAANLYFSRIAAARALAVQQSAILPWEMVPPESTTTPVPQ